MVPARQRIADGQAGRHCYPRAAFESKGAFQKDFGRAGAWSACARRERVRKDFRFHWERNSPDSEISAASACFVLIGLTRQRTTQAEFRSKPPGSFRSRSKYSPTRVCIFEKTNLVQCLSVMHIMGRRVSENQDKI